MALRSVMRSYNKSSGLMSAAPFGLQNSAGAAILLMLATTELTSKALTVPTRSRRVVLSSVFSK
jgi:hypothetical protein